MYIWKNTETEEVYENEKNYISIGVNGDGTETYAYIGDSNVILFSLSGNASIESMEDVFYDSHWTITKKE